MSAEFLMMPKLSRSQRTAAPAMAMDPWCRTWFTKLLSNDDFMISVTNAKHISKKSQDICIMTLHI